MAGLDLDVRSLSDPRAVHVVVRGALDRDTAEQLIETLDLLRQGAETRLLIVDLTGTTRVGAHGGDRLVAHARTLPPELRLVVIASVVIQDILLAGGDALTVCRSIEAALDLLHGPPPVTGAGAGAPAGPATSGPFGIGAPAAGSGRFDPSAGSDRFAAPAGSGGHGRIPGSGGYGGVPGSGGHPGTGYGAGGSSGRREGLSARRGPPPGAPAGGSGGFAGPGAGFPPPPEPSDDLASDSADLYIGESGDDLSDVIRPPPRKAAPADLPPPGGDLDLELGGSSDGFDPIGLGNTEGATTKLPPFEVGGDPLAGAHRSIGASVEPGGEPAAPAPDQPIESFDAYAPGSSPESSPASSPPSDLFPRLDEPQAPIAGAPPGSIDVSDVMAGRGLSGDVDETADPERDLAREIDKLEEEFADTREQGPELAGDILAAFSAEAEPEPEPDRAKKTETDEKETLQATAPSPAAAPRAPPPAAQPPPAAPARPAGDLVLGEIAPLLDGHAAPSAPSATRDRPSEPDTDPAARRPPLSSTATAPPGAPRTTPSPDATPASSSEADPVRFAAWAPDAIGVRARFVLEVFAFVEEQRDAMAERAARAGRHAEAGDRGPVKIARGTELTVVLDLPGFEVPDVRDTLLWTGEVSNVGFAATAPAEPGVHVGTVRILVASVPLARLSFELTVTGDDDAGDALAVSIPIRERRVRRAFASFDAADRPSVLAFQRRLAPVGIELATDVIARRASGRWDEELEREVPASDLFCLFWSEAASCSPWVEKEWRCALDRRGVDYIHPVPLVDPGLCPPPAELSEAAAVFGDAARTRGLRMRPALRPRSDPARTTVSPYADHPSGDATRPPPTDPEAGGLADARTTDVPAEVREALADPGRRVGRYVLLDELGRGGMGVVHRAWDVELQRPVAIKMIGGRMGAERRARFTREARAAARLRHPGIVAVHDVGEHDGRPFIVMEFIDGETLEDSLERDPPSAERIAGIAREISLALAHAHARGVIHRDVKPHNVLLDDDGRPLVTDFGLARDLEGEGLTSSGQPLGTPAYMAPEQAAGRPGEQGPATDVYAVGVVIYRALTGRTPFTDGVDNPIALATRIIRDDPTPPSELEPDIPDELEAIVLRCLRKRPDERWGSAEELASALEAFLAG